MPVETPDDDKMQELFMETSASEKLNHKNVMADPAVLKGAVAEIQKSVSLCSLAN